MISVCSGRRALCSMNLCGIYDSGIRDDTFYTRPFYADGNTPYYLVEGSSWRPDNPNAKFPRLGIEARDNGGKFLFLVGKRWYIFTFEISSVRLYTS